MACCSLLTWAETKWVRQLIIHGSIISSINMVITRTSRGIQFSSVAQSCPTLCDPMNCSNQASLFITNTWSLPKLRFIKSVMPSSHLILCRPLLLLPQVPPRIRVFQWVSSSMRWPKYWSLSFSISPSKQHPGLISVRMGWLDLLAGTFKSLFQQHSSKASILRHSAFFIVQLSHPYVSNKKTKL